MNKYKAALGPILGLLSASIWALAFSNVKIALKTFGPSEIAALRFFVSGLLGVGVLMFTKQKTWTAKDIFQAFFAAFVGMAIYNFFLNLGQTTIAPSAASFIVSTQPIFTIIAARFLFKEKIGLNAILGVALCLMGVWVILGHPDFSAFFHGGAFYLIICAICSGLYFILLMPLIQKHGPLNAAASTVLATGILLCPWLPNALVQAQIELKPTLAVMFLAIFPGFIAHITWMSTMKIMGSTRAANFTFLIAPMATIAAIIINDDKIVHTFYFGSVLVIFGVFVTTNQKIKTWFLEKTKFAL